MNIKLATRLALISGAVLLIFVLVGYVLAATLLPAGGHQLSGLLLGDTDLGPPWLAVALFVVALGFLPGKGWRRRLGALLMALCGLGYAVTQLSSISAWFTEGAAGSGSLWRRPQSWPSASLPLPAGFWPGASVQTLPKWRAIDLSVRR